MLQGEVLESLGSVHLSIRLTHGLYSLSNLGGVLQQRIRHTSPLNVLSQGTEGEQLPWVSSGSDGETEAWQRAELENTQRKHQVAP